LRAHDRKAELRGGTDLWLEVARHFLVVHARAALDGKVGVDRE